MSQFWRGLQRLRAYPSAILGLAIIVALGLLSIYTVIAIPYSEAIRLWKGGETVWADHPKNARPVWSNWLSGTKQPRTVIVDSRETGVERSRETISEGIEEMVFSLEFEYEADDFPPELILFLETDYADKQPFVELTWHTPDGREIRAGEVTPTRSDDFRFALDEALTRRLDGQRAEVGLFADPDTGEVVQGEYRLEVTSLLFEPEQELEAKLVVFGEVHGLAGTDHQRRDLSVALLWGTPIALAFGLLAAVGTTITTMAIAAVGVWFGGWLDETIQRITEVNLILPLLPILIMVGTLYNRSIWVMLGVVIVLSIFGASIKSYRAIFLQVRTLPYIEAAQAYGASNLRIIFRYLVPRTLPLVIPSLVILVPSFVFLEASLAVLGLGDPVLPTWGKVINDANSQGALFNGYYYWILEPAALLMLAGLAFAMVGFALDRVFNPRLREL